MSDRIEERARLAAEELCPEPADDDLFLAGKKTIARHYRELRESEAGVEVRERAKAIADELIKFRPFEADDTLARKFLADAILEAIVIENNKAVAPLVEAARNGLCALAGTLDEADEGRKDIREVATFIGEKAGLRAQIGNAITRLQEALRDYPTSGPAPKENES